MNNVHPTSIIHEGCEIDENVTIGAYSIIGPNVKIGKLPSGTVKLENCLNNFEIIGSIVEKISS